MSVKITSLKEATTGNGIKILIYGTTGIGKTVLCATANMKTLMISAEAGLLSLKGAPIDMDVAVVNTIDDLAEIYEELALEKHDYELICLDSVSEIGEVLLSEEKAKVNDARQAYGVLQDEIMKMLRLFRDLPHHIVFIAKQERFTDDYTGITTQQPSMPGRNLPQQIGYLFDEVMVLRMVKDEEGIVGRWLQCDRDITYEAKDRSGNLELFEEANLEQIFNKITGE